MVSQALQRTRAPLPAHKRANICQNRWASGNIKFCSEGDADRKSDTLRNCILPHCTFGVLK